MKSYKEPITSLSVFEFRYINVGLLFFVILYIYSYDITSIKSLVEQINILFDKKIDISKISIFIVTIYSLGLFTSFVSYIFFEIVITQLFKIFPWYRKNDNYLDEIASKLLKNRFNFTMLNSLENYKRLESLIFINDNSSLKIKFLNDKRRVLTLRDFLMVLFIANFIFYKELGYISIVIIPLLLIAYFILSIYDDILLKSYIEALYFNNLHSNPSSSPH